MNENGEQHHTLTAAAGDAGERLDRFLAARMEGLSRSRVKVLIEAGAVRAGGAPILDPAYKVRAEQTFAIIVPESTPASPQAQAIALNIVYEDEDLIVVDKSPGMVVHPAPGSADGTLVNALLAHCGDSLSGVGGVRRPGIVHRLDKDTSGLLVAAKNDVTHQGLATQFAVHSVDRAYRALVWGIPRPLEGSIEGNVGRSRADRKKMAVVKSGGRPALTRYRTLRTLADGLVSLIECRLETGRTHQIRVHLSAVGHPLIGDPVYGRARHSKTAALPPPAAAALKGFGRQALDACELGFTHPKTLKRLLFKKKLSNDIKELIDILEQN